MAAFSVVLTQPASRIGSIDAALRRLDVDVACWPLIVTMPEPQVDWPKLFDELARCVWAVLPSPAAVAVVMGQASARGLRWPAACGIALVGPGSGQAVMDWQPRVAGLANVRMLTPENPPYDAARLLDQPLLADLEGQRIAVLSRGDVPDRWRQALLGRGAMVQTFVVYRAMPVGPPAGAADWLAARAAEDATTVFSIASADAGRRLARWIGGLACARWAMSRPVLTVHPRIAHALTESGWPAVRLHRPGVDGLLEGLESIRRGT